MASTYNFRPIPVKGQSLPLSHKDRIQRAFVAADLYLGVVTPTQRQAAVLAGVNRTYVYWAIKRRAERAEIEAGRVPLVPARTNGNSGHDQITAAEPTTITDDLLAYIAHIVGPDRMLDAAVALDH